MPESSRFYGIVIKMYFADHAPLHFHAEYGDNQMVVNLDTLAIIAGKLPPRATGLVMEWARCTRMSFVLTGNAPNKWSRCSGLHRCHK